MNAIKLISIIFYFLRAMIFENPREWDWKSPHFDIRKMLLLVLLLESLILNALVLHINHKLVLTKEELVRTLKQNKIPLPKSVAKKNKDSATEDAKK